MDCDAAIRRQVIIGAIGCPSLHLWRRHGARLSPGLVPGGFLHASGWRMTRLTYAEIYRNLDGLVALQVAASTPLRKHKDEKDTAFVKRIVATYCAVAQDDPEAATLTSQQSRSET